MAKDKREPLELRPDQLGPVIRPGYESADAVPEDGNPWIKRRKPARDATVKLGDIFGDDMPDDMLSAGLLIIRRLTAKSTAGEYDVFSLAKNLVIAAYVDVWSDALREGRDSGRGAVGPRLPENVSFGDLLPHLSEASRVFGSKEMRFDDWCTAHTWPAGMKVNPGTCRTWIARYARYIDDYDQLMAALSKN